MLRSMEGRFDGRPSFMETLHANTAATVCVTEILHVFKFGPFVPLDYDTATLLDAVLILGKHGLHRVCVVKAGGDIVNIVTQSAVIGALTLALPKLKSVTGRTLRDLGLHESPHVYTVPLDESVWVALKVRHPYMHTPTPTHPPTHTHTPRRYDSGLRLTYLRC